jgi:hypothetical protein
MNNVEGSLKKKKRKKEKGKNKESHAAAFLPQAASWEEIACLSERK